MLKYYVALGIAILSEIAGTLSLKLSVGFTRLSWTLFSIGLYLIMLYCLSYAMRVVPLSVAYGLWTGSGTFLTAILGVVVFHETLTIGQIFGLVLLVIGVVALNWSGEAEEELDYEQLQIDEKFDIR
ncbi:DMT family transporter [Secundilactobacillus odoratitofui]|nr:multidrug efflux SMR transporter [Secundilactobacillus odoratitofui]